MRAPPLSASSATSAVEPSAVVPVDRESPGRVRLEWLDFFRGLAVLVMIETHVANTFLATADWPVDWRVMLNYVNGLVAPGFLFIAGYAHGCGLRRKRAVRSRAWPRLVRLAGIAALGYLMHLPVREIAAGQWADAWLIGTRMNILPCLAGAVAVLVAIDRVCHRHAMMAVSVVMAATVVGASNAVGWTGPAPLVAMVNQSTGSLFPLLPWAAFAFAGFSVSGSGPGWRAFGPLALASAGAVWVLGRTDLSPVSAAFFFERLAWILALVPVCGWVAERWSWRAVLYAGRESLAMYVAHLAFISILQAVAIPKVGVPWALAIYAGVVAATFAAVRGWRWLSVARADRARRAAHRRESLAPAA